MKHNDASGKHVLLIEDDLGDVALTKRALKKAGITNPLILTEDGESALDFLFGAGAHAGRDIHLQPALILLDLNMPKIDGFRVLQRVRATPQTRRLPVVVLTSSRRPQDVAASYDLGANSYIRKSIDFTTFVSTIGQVCHYWLVLNEPPPMAIAP